LEEKTLPRTDEIFNKPNNVNEIKRSNLELAGHVCRKQDSIVVHRVFQENPSFKRPLDRPRLCWEYGIRKDFQMLEKGITEILLNLCIWKKIAKTKRNAGEFFLWQDGLKKPYKKKWVFSYWYGHRTLLIILMIS